MFQKHLMAIAQDMMGHEVWKKGVANSIYNMMPILLEKPYKQGI